MMVILVVIMCYTIRSFLVCSIISLLKHDFFMNTFSISIINDAERMQFKALQEKNDQLSYSQNYDFEEIHEERDDREEVNKEIEEREDISTKQYQNDYELLLISYLQSKELFNQCHLNVYQSMLNQKDLQSLYISKENANRIDTILQGFHVFNVSLYSISFNERLRIIVTDDCPPAFPPVSISIGMNEVKTT